LNFSIALDLGYPNPYSGASPLGVTGCRTDGSGNFSDCIVTIPFDPNGSYWVMAIAGGGPNVSSSNFIIRPVLVLSSTSGKGPSGTHLGRLVDVAGAGYPHYASVSLYFYHGSYNTSLASCTYLSVSSAGVLTPCAFDVPTNAAANYTVAAMDAYGSGTLYVTALFKVPGPWLSATPLGHFGSVLSVVASGGGFVPNTPVYFEYRNSPVLQSTCLTGLLGSFSSCTMQLPYVQRNYAINWTLWAWDKECQVPIWAIPTCGQAAIGTVSVGNGPSSLALDPVLGEIYVTNSQSGAISVLSNVTGQVLATFSTGPCPTGIAFDPVFDEMFVTDACSNVVSVIQDSSNSIVATIPAGVGPTGIAYDGLQGYLIAANSGSNSVSVISDAINAVVNTIGVGPGPMGVAYDYGVQRAYVTNTQGSSVSVVNPLGGNMPLAQTLIPVGQCPEGIAYDPGMSEVFVADSCSGTLSVIADWSNTVISTPWVGGQPVDLVYDSDNGAVLVTDYAQDMLDIINDATGNITISVPTQVSGTSGVIYVGGQIAVVTGILSGTVTYIFTGDGTSTWFWY
jgi:YVTN family beta-propeller protein